MNIRTRFAPSPTGYLHIGSARTALFNYLFAKHHGGKFLLRIEDTDAARSNEARAKEILDSLKWLGIEHDEEIIYQSTRSARHKEIAEYLLSIGKAYYCFSSQEEVGIKREEAINAGEHFIFNSPWRNANPKDYPQDIKPVVRLKAPREGETIVDDLLQGKIVVQNSQLDDMILLRSDGTPTYMLAVVVDDHDMGITHIIRGDDHLTNAPRQQIIYQALGWQVPKMVHIPLIHGPDGAKLSKRHGAIGVESYRDMGYLPEALNNYLLRLGWAHGDDEIIHRSQAIEWFDIDGMGKSPARLDFDKMRYINSYYLRNKNNDDLLELILTNLPLQVTEESKIYLKLGLDSIKPRAELVTELCSIANIYIIDKPITISKEAEELINSCNKELIKNALSELIAISDSEFNKDKIQSVLKNYAEKNNMKLGELMKFIRPFITGQVNSPSVFEIVAIIGKGHTVKRIKSILEHTK